MFRVNNTFRTRIIDSILTSFHHASTQTIFSWLLVADIVNLCKMRPAKESSKPEAMSQRLNEILKIAPEPPFLKADLSPID